MMIKIISILILIFYTTVNFAVDDSVFLDKYPGIKTYQSQCLSGFNLYFFTLLSRSILLKDSNNQYQIHYQNEKEDSNVVINARIERSIVKNELNEYVEYVLPNGNRFDFLIKKTGLDQLPSVDEDLLTMNFKKLTSNYELVIFPLRLSVYKTDIKDFILLEIFEINFSIQTIFKEDSASRSYIYFYKDMPNPQIALTVQVSEDSGDSQSLNYIHSSKGAEISPKYFFKGLGEGSQVFSEFSGMSKVILREYGFPPIPGIN